MVAKGLAQGTVVGLLVTAVQMVYCLYPERFLFVLAIGAVLLLFYRKLDRIEAALSERRREDQFRYRLARERWLAGVITALVVVGGGGSYAVWKWLAVG